jgi:transcription initiation factor TFIID subunit 5
MDYLQQHGYDRILKTLNEGLVKDPSSDNAKEAGSAGDASLEAFFVAPAPIDLTSITQRNLPQAQSVSASTMSDRITPEFEAQAKYIIDMLEKRLGVQNKAAEGDDEGKAEADPERDADSLLDTSERVQGYRLYRQWVDSNLDMWKVSCQVWDRGDKCNV